MRAAYRLEWLQGTAPRKRVLTTGVQREALAEYRATQALLAERDRHTLQLWRGSRLVCGRQRRWARDTQGVLRMETQER